MIREESIRTKSVLTLRKMGEMLKIDIESMNDKENYQDAPQILEKILN